MKTFQNVKVEVLRDGKTDYFGDLLGYFKQLYNSTDDIDFVLEIVDEATKLLLDEQRNIKFIDGRTRVMIRRLY